MVVEVDELIYKFSGLLEGFDFLTVDTLCFEDREEIFSHGVIITVSPS